MQIRCSFPRLSCALLTTALLLPVSSLAQTSHARAKAVVEARDARHHNKLKTEGIPTAGGAVGGAIAAGPAGAFAGAKIGHGIGTGFHAIKKHHDIKQVEKHGTVRHGTRVRTVRTRAGARRHTYRRN